MWNQNDYVALRMAREQNQAVRAAVEAERLAERAQSTSPARAPVLRGVLWGVGRQLEQWGQALQTRYSMPPKPAEA